MKTSNFLRIGVFYDGTFFTKAQQYFWGRDYGWLSFRDFHQLIERYLETLVPGYSDYKIVYSAWFQGLYKETDATEKNLRDDRRKHLDQLHAGIEVRNVPMSESKKEKGIDVFMAVETLQIGLEDKIDIAILVTGDGDFVPLVRALMKHGVKVAIAYFKYTEPDGKDSFVNPRLIKAANYSININGLEQHESFGNQFKAIFNKHPDKRNMSENLDN